MNGELGSRNLRGKNIEKIIFMKNLGLPKNCDANITGQKKQVPE